MPLTHPKVHNAKPVSLFDDGGLFLEVAPGDGKEKR